MLDILDTMIERRLTKNRTSFCEDWLDRSNSYLCAVKGRVSKDAMMTLWRRLLDARQDDLAGIVFARMIEGKSKKEAA